MASARPDSDALRIANLPRTGEDALRFAIDELIRNDKELRQRQIQFTNELAELRVELREARSEIQALKLWQWFCYGIAAVISFIAAYLLDKPGR